MVDKKNLNRVKGILSARQGAEIPKYETGNKIVLPAFNPGDTSFQQWKSKATNASSNFMTAWRDYSVLKAEFPTASIDDLASYMNSGVGPGGVTLNSLYSKYTDASSGGTNSVSTVPGANPDEGNPGAAVEQAASQQSQQNAAVVNQQVQQQAAAQVQQTGNTDVNNTGNQGTDKKVTATELSAGMVLTPEEAAKLKKYKGFETGAQLATAAFQGIGTAVGAAQQASDSNLTKGADQFYNTAAQAVESLGPVGKIVGTAMQNAKIAGDLIQGLGGGTDQQTTTDKWMDSAFFSWNIGMINGFGGKKSDSFAVDQDVVSEVGSSYGGTVDDLNDAASKAGKKYGLFSSRARKKANKAIAEAKAKQNLMGDIADSSSDQRLAVQSMGEQAGLAYSLMTDGGYNQKYTYAAKHGGILEWNLVETLEWEPQVELNWELPEFKEGGSIELQEELEWIPEFKSGGKTTLSKEVLDFYKDYDLSDINVVMSESPRTEGNTIYISNDEDAIHELWHYLSKNTANEMYKDFYHNLNDDKIVTMGGDLQFVKRFNGDPGHFYHPSELEARVKSAKFKTKGQDYTKEFFQNLRSDENKYGYNMRDLLHMYNDDNLVKIFSLKNGGSVGDSDIPEIEETNQKNVIPEGALHKNKHHMEHADGLTKKGIPVIDDEGEQQAEIEHSEIIFTLEVTKKLEEYYEIFYSEESSNKEKEQAAIDAGKLLVFQILENTEDRTGLIESCKKGGTLTFKKTTDDLIEEVLDWAPTLVIVEETEVVEKPKKESDKKSDKEIMKEAIKEVLIELLTK
jgi:hypothetical protein